MFRVEMYIFSITLFTLQTRSLGEMDSMEKSTINWQEPLPCNSGNIYFLLFVMDFINEKIETKLNIFIDFHWF